MDGRGTQQSPGTNNTGGHGVIFGGGLPPQQQGQMPGQMPSQHMGMNQPHPPPGPFHGGAGGPQGGPSYYQRMMPVGVNSPYGMIPPQGMPGFPPGIIPNQGPQSFTGGVPGMMIPSPPGSSPMMGSGHNRPFTSPGVLGLNNQVSQNGVVGLNNMGTQGVGVGGIDGSVHMSPVPGGNPMNTTSPIHAGSSGSHITTGGSATTGFGVNSGAKNSNNNESEVVETKREANVWKEMKNTEGRIFWHNAYTKKSVWSKPFELQNDEEKYLSGNTQWLKYLNTDSSSYWSHSLTNESSWKTPEEVQTFLDRFQELTTELEELPTEPKHTTETPNYAKINDKNNAKRLLKLFFEYKGHGKYHQKSWEEVSKLWNPVTPPDWGHKKVRETDRGKSSKWFPLDARAFSFTSLTAGERKQCFNEYWNVLNKKLKEHDRKIKVTMKDMCQSELLKRKELFPWSTFADMSDEMHDRPWWHYLDEKEKQTIFDEIMEGVFHSVRFYSSQIRGNRSCDRRSLPTFDPKGIKWKAEKRDADLMDDRPLTYDPFLTVNSLRMIRRLFPNIYDIDYLTFQCILEGLKRNAAAQEAMVNYELELLSCQKLQKEEKTEDVDASKTEPLSDCMFEVTQGIGEGVLDVLYDPRSAMEVVLHMDRFAMLRCYQSLVKDTVTDVHDRMDRAADSNLCVRRSAFVKLIHEQMRVGKITPTSSFRKFMNSKVSNAIPKKLMDLDQLVGFEARTASRKKYFDKIINDLENVDVKTRSVRDTLDEKSGDIIVSEYWAYLDILGSEGANPREIYDFTTIKIHEGMVTVVKLLTGFFNNHNINISQEIKSLSFEQFEKLIESTLRRINQEDWEEKQLVLKALELLLSRAPLKKATVLKQFGHEDILEISYQRIMRESGATNKKDPVETASVASAGKLSQDSPSVVGGVTAAGQRKNALG